MAAPHVFGFFGHGSELFEDIEINGETFPKEVDLPEGYTLVLTEECGVIGTIPPHIFRIMADPANLPFFQNPETHIETLTKLLKKNIKVYVGPRKIPNFHLTFFNDDHGEGGKTRLEQSGVLEVPLKNIEIGAKVYPPNYHAYVSSRQVQFKDLQPFYKNAVFPNLEDIFSSLIDESNNGDLNTFKIRTETFKEETGFWISDVFDEVGPGIYYNFLCRSIQNLNKTTVPVNEFVYNEPAFIYHKLKTMPEAERTENENALLNKTRAIIASRKGYSPVIESKTIEPRFQRLLEVMSAQELNAPTTSAVLKQIQSLPVDLLNSLKSTHEGNTLLHLSMLKADTTLLDALLMRGVDLTVRNYHEQTPLHIACANRFVNTCHRLLGVIEPSAVGLKDEEEKTVLMLACDNNLPSIVNHLLQTPDFIPFLDFTAADKDGDTALHLACIEDAERCCLQLINKEPELLTVSNSSDETPWESAIKAHSGRCMDVIQKFAPTYAAPIENAMTLFLNNRSDENSQVTGVLALLAAGILPEKKNLDYAVNTMRSNTISVILFDSLFGRGLLSAADIHQYQQISIVKMRPFVNHVVAQTSAGASSASAAASAGTRRRRQMRKMKTRRLRIRATN